MYNFRLAHTLEKLKYFEPSTTKLTNINKSSYILLLTNRINNLCMIKKQNVKCGFSDFSNSMVHIECIKTALIFALYPL